ncbi:hypothetical protein KAV79_07655, partial [Candidatus Aerophobetes bacterium]|nr:hypothetical protein [Candidatus Aerophobetes bacterium]
VNVLARHFPVIARLVPSASEGTRRSNLIHPKGKCIWVQVRILHETEKAILIDNGRKTWIPKSRIYRIRLKNNIFEIYVKESIVGNFNF